VTEVKISVIGAGSAVFSMRLVRDVCLTPPLQGSTVSFMDINEERLNIVHNLAQRYAQETHTDLKLEKTTDRAHAILDADFVVNTALIGGHTDVEQERKVEEVHGYYRGMRLGSYFHQLNFMLDVIQDMEDLCPNAWLIQASNPVFDGCTLMNRESSINVLGLCHGHFGVYKIARILQLDRAAIAFQAPGVNHCIWMNEFRYKGRDAYPILDNWITTQAEDYWKSWEDSPTEVQMSPAAVSLYKMFGLFPIGDTPRFAGAWWHHVDLATKKKWFNKYGGFDSEIGWQHYLTRLEKRMKIMQQLAQSHSSVLTAEFPPEQSGEQHIPIIDALTNDHEGTFQVNVMNNGALPGFRNDLVVEVPGIVNGGGVKAIQVQPFPKALIHHIQRTQIIPMELGVEAWTSGDRNILVNKVLADHRTQSYEQAQNMIDAIFSLPFNADLQAHFK
jgi:alpha-galactosidase